MSFFQRLRQQIIDFHFSLYFNYFNLNYFNFILIPIILIIIYILWVDECQFDHLTVDKELQLTLSGRSIFFYLNDTFRCRTVKHTFLFHLKQKQQVSNFGFFISAFYNLKKMCINSRWTNKKIGQKSMNVAESVGGVSVLRVESL